MTPGDNLRQLWDRLIEDRHQEMTKVVVNREDYLALKADRNEDHSFDYRAEGLTFRTLPVERDETATEPMIQTRKA